jgi:hypothetical protein
VGEEGLEGLKLTDSGDGSDDLSELELVKDSGFTSSIQSNHEDSCTSVDCSITHIVREEVECFLIPYIHVINRVMSCRVV